MFIETIVLPPIMENCYIVHDGKSAIVFDPGSEFDHIQDFLTKRNLVVNKIFFTHGHFDHIGAASQLHDCTNAPIYAHKGDLDVINDGCRHASFFGLGSFPIPKVDTFLDDNDVIDCGFTKVKAIHTPGHSHGGVCYYIEGESMLISGDTLFLESIGRTDLLGGDFATLKKSIKERLFVLPDDTKAYPGHGDATSIGHEKKFNPYVKS